MATTSLKHKAAVGGSGTASTCGQRVMPPSRLGVRLDDQRRVGRQPRRLQRRSQPARRSSWTTMPARPPRKAIRRWPSPIRCSVARRAPPILSGVTLLIQPARRRRITVDDRQPPGLDLGQLRLSVPIAGQST